MRVISEHLRFRAAPHVVAARTAGGTVLMDRKRGQYHTLNDVGSRVWALLAADTSVDAVARQIADEYELPPGANSAQLTQDIIRLVRQFDGEGLLIVVDGYGN